MSFVVTAPEMVTAAAENLAGIGSTLGEATAAAAAPTTGIATAAADEISLAISQLFGTYGHEFQAISAQASAFHSEFVSLLNGGAAAYLGAELANAQALPAQAAAAVAASESPYQLLIENTNTNLESLLNNWLANPTPFARQIFENQRIYSQEIAAAFNNFVQYFPQNLANLPAAIQTGIQGLVTFPFAAYTQQFITTQIAFTQSFISHLNNAATGILAGLPTFYTGLEVAFQTALAGNYFGAVQQVGTALGNLLITGFDVSNYTVNLDVNLPSINVTATAFPVPLGPLPEFFNAIAVLGQDSQYLTNLTSPLIPRQMLQNLTNVFNAISDPSIEALATLQVNILGPTAVGTLSGFFGLPVVLGYAAIGAPITTLDGLATTLTAGQQALLNGNYLGALGVVVDSPAVITNSFLNGQVIQDVPIPVATGIGPPFAPPLPTVVTLTLHLPFDGILVPPHYATATVSANNTIPIPGIPFEATIFGTPFMGLTPLLINYLPQQLAIAITPQG
ncbi:MAG: PE family protein [Mycobacterium sp.]